MERRRFGSTKREIAVIGQGTWYIENGAPAIAALRRGFDLGMTHIDTAEMYGSGAAEEVVAEAIAGRRDEIFLVSKVLPQNASRRGTILACDGSLARLNTDRLDCYLLHWRGQHPLEDTIAAFEELKSAGKILSWGVSNFDLPDLEDVRKIAGEGNLVCNQVLYHLEERAIEHAVIPWCEKRGVAVVALRDTQSRQPRTRRRKREGRGNPVDQRRGRPNPRGFPARLASLSPSHAISQRSGNEGFADTTITLQNENAINDQQRI
jgi:diketogulonate reductase-like aldo/keto reductase